MILHSTNYLYPTFRRPSPRKTRRASTTARLTRNAIALIDWSCKQGECVIIRHKGVEYGVESVCYDCISGVYAMVYSPLGTYPIDLNSTCTIPKTTLAHLTLLAECRKSA